jgi:hypothetical protein
MVESQREEKSKGRKIVDGTPREKEKKGQNVMEPRLPRVLSIYLPTAFLMWVLSLWTIKAINQSNCRE